MTGRELALERVGGEVRLAVLEESRLCGIYFECGDHGALKGNIYAGRVQNVLPGMNAAFVDIGMKRNGFLGASDVGLDLRGEDVLRDRLGQARIERMLRPGQSVVVQVVKEPGGGKGPRLSCSPTLPGRLTVLLPTLRYAGVSKKISDGPERDRLFTAAQALSEETGMGIIVRTVAEGASEAALREDCARLVRDWRRIEVEAKHSAAPRLIRADGDLTLKAVRDMLTEKVVRVRTDDAELYRRLIAHAQALTPELVERIELVESRTPLFDLLRVDHQLDEALERRVNLDSGGNLVIDETEAFTIIDVNTAKFTGRHSLRETIFRLNCEAADEIARQLRLRDVGGIVIVDFIDMDSEEDRAALLAHLRDALRADPNRTKVLGMTALGLVEITRKKERQPLHRQLTCNCEACRGSGHVLSHESIAYRAARELWRRRRGGDGGAYMIRTGAKVAARLKTIELAGGGAVRVDASGEDDGFEILPDDGGEKV